MSTYYRLKDNIVLRGYTNIPLVIINILNGDSLILKDYSKLTTDFILNMCNGEVDFDKFNSKSYIFNDIIKHFLDISVIEEKKDITPLNENQKFKQYDRIYIHKAFLFVTRKCNLKCKHCMMSSPGCDKELSTEDLFYIIDQLKENDIYIAELNGGECFSRSDICDIIDKCTENNIKLSDIYTNGTLLTQDKIDAVKRNGSNPKFYMSYDGVGVHNWLRGDKNAERDLMKGIELCFENGIIPSINMVLHKKNCDANIIRRTVNFLTKIGINEFIIASMLDIGNWKYNSEYALNPVDACQSELNYLPYYFIDNLHFKLDIFGISPLFGSRKCTNKYSIGTSSSYFQFDISSNPCTTDRRGSAAHISPEGKLLSCSRYFTDPDFIFAKSAPYITEVGINECIKSNSYMFSRKLGGYKYYSKSPCFGCKYFKYCGGGCRYISYKENGKFNGAYSLKCEFYKNKWYNKVVELVKKYNPSMELDIGELNTLLDE